MPLWNLLILPVLLSDAPAAWPIDLPENREITQEDLDRDGHPDERAQASDGGSGWKEFDTCVRHGAAGHVACEETASTAYSLFSAEHRVLVPSSGNRAEALLGPEDCAAPNPADPTQGAMWALRAPIPAEGRMTPTGPWRPGRPQDQRSVYLSTAEAADLAGGLTWNAAGDSSAALAAEGWRVRYSAAWPQWVSQGQAHVRTPRRVSQVGALDVYQHGHALAVYDPVDDRHAWIANLVGASGDGFKFDRWESIASVAARACADRHAGLCSARENRAVTSVSADGLDRLQGGADAHPTPPAAPLELAPVRLVHGPDRRRRRGPPSLAAPDPGNRTPRCPGGSPRRRAAQRPVGAGDPGAAAEAGQWDLRVRLDP